MNEVLTVLNGCNTVSVTDGSGGDSGKGKVVDLFTPWADIIARGTGGDNAGHTIVRGGKVFAQHILPCGILFDAEGKQSIIGRGVALSPRALVKELTMLKKNGHSYNNLRISDQAHLIMPHEIALDLLGETNARGIGSTGRGIGPVYTHAVARHGLIVNDLLNPFALAKKLHRSIEKTRAQFSAYDADHVKEALHHERLESGRYWAGPQKLFDENAIFEQYLVYAREFAHLIADTDEIMLEAVGKKRILLEGAQGLLLSVKYGTYPYVTSSDCSPEGLAAGVGLTRSVIDRNFSVVKFLPTRVGKGPLPTEIGGAVSERWCNPDDGDFFDAERELKHFGVTSVNDPDSLRQSYALRDRGGERGVSTGRPRRMAWPDMTLLRYARHIQGQDIIITKPDPYWELERIQVCTQYRCIGPKYRIADMTYERGDVIADLRRPDSILLERIEPVYETMDGWLEPLDGVQCYRDLPLKLRDILRRMQALSGARFPLVSIGPSAEETLFVT